MIYLYSLILYLICPLIPLYLKKRGRKNHLYNQDWHERFGTRLTNASKKPLIWVHAVSVGEVRAAAKLIELLNIEYPNYQILITQMTPTGRATARELYKTAIIHYIPYDLPHAVNNFYKTFRPKIGLIMETEIWPNLLHYSKKYKVPLFLVNARLSNKSFKSYNKIKILIKPILNNFTAILCQDNITQDNFIKLGFNKLIKVVGSTKFDLMVNDEQINKAYNLKKDISGKKVVIFASTREGEEHEIINNIKNQEYLTIIVPRHPERFSLVEQILIKNSIKYIKRSENKVITNDVQVFLGDSMGEMFSYYAMADIAVIGGSFNNSGGQNLIEPIYLNKPVIIGPSTFNFAKIVQDAIDEGCTIQVKNMAECCTKIEEIFNDPYIYNNMVASCKVFSAKYQGASQKTLDSINQYI